VLNRAEETFLMTKEEAIRKALDYAQAASLDVGSIVDVKYLDINDLDEKAKACPLDLVETYHSVRKNFRNQWVVTFQAKSVPEQVSCPETRLVCVFETGEAMLFASP
jgi:hypothetical protein